MVYLIVLMLILQDFLPVLQIPHGLSYSLDAYPAGLSACPPDSMVYLIVLMLILQDILPVLQILLHV
jgi:hypothetical protein